MRRQPSSGLNKRRVVVLLLIAAGCTAGLVQAAQAASGGDIRPGPSIPDPQKGKPAKPTISGFNPSSGPVGTAVTVSGTNFTGVNKVTFNGTSAAYTVNSSTQLTATVPAGAGSGSIAVTNGAGTGTSSSSFTVTTGGSPDGVYVSPTGSDATGDGSLSKPFATLGKAQATMRLGGSQTAYI